MELQVEAPVPPELAEREQWVAWRYEHRAGETKPTKVPYDARTGQRASTTDPSTWTSLERAQQFCVTSGAAGVGYVLSEHDPYVGVDLDHCRNPQSGAIDHWARDIVTRLNSYTEVSPSGAGLRIFVRGDLPPRGRRKGSIEMYTRARFLTITGDRYYAAPRQIFDRNAELQTWHHEIFGDPPAAPTPRAARDPVQLADAELLRKAHEADNGAAFWSLWNGDYSAYDSQSEADLALCNHLAFWCGPDPARIDQLFRASGLMREKWDRADYRDATIDKALEGRTEFYGTRNNSQFGIGASVTMAADGKLWRTIVELFNSKPEKQEQLVEHFIWQGKTHWLYSGPGAGKTLTELAALMHMAAGKPFCGLKVVQGAVVIIEEDSPDSVMAEYIGMLADIYDIDLEGLPLYFNRPRGLRLTDKAGFDLVSRMIAEAPTKPAICLIDACERLVPSEHFNSKELEWVGRLFADNLANGITNIMIDHTRKPGPSGGEKIDLIDLLYGGRTKSAISDIMMFFSGAIKNKATVSFPKFRGEAPSPMTISFDGAAGFTIKQAKIALSETERKVMEVLNNAFGSPLSREDIEAKAQTSERSANRVLKRLVDLGWVMRSGEHRETRYAVSGQGGGVVFG